MVRIRPDYAKDIYQIICPEWRHHLRILKMVVMLEPRLLHSTNRGEASQSGEYGIF